ncbi:MAG: hypothetical protein ACRCZO_01530, partial [Cetobacterium sp.]
TERVVFGPPGSPAALHTRLGWALQGPMSLITDNNSTSQCHFLAVSTKDQLQRDAERLRQVDVFPYSQTFKAVFQSKRDQEAAECLEQRTECLQINGVLGDSTPLLQAKYVPKLNTSQQSVMPVLYHTKCQLAKNPKCVSIYEQEMQKFVKYGYEKKLTQGEITLIDEFWYVPHQWPKYPSIALDNVSMELRKPLFCGQTQVSVENFPPDLTPENRLGHNQAELLLLRYPQGDDFSEKEFLKSIPMREIHQAVTMKEKLQPRWPSCQSIEIAASVPAHEPVPEPAPPWLPVHLWPPGC